MSLALLVQLVHGTKLDDSWAGQVAEAAGALYGSQTGRYALEAQTAVSLRNPGIQSSDDKVPFAAWLHRDNPTKSVYGGMSIAIFPVPGHPCLITLCVGTGGLPPDEAILGRPGHGRNVRAICLWLNRKHGHGQLVAWAKQDPVKIDEPAPASVVGELQRYKSVFDRYGKVLYGVYAPTGDQDATREALAAFFDLMFAERGYGVIANAKADASRIKTQWMAHLAPDISEQDLATLLAARRYAVIQGPPGTGKTRMALSLLQTAYRRNGMRVQFHPGVTYESFVGGLAPAQQQEGIGFQFAPLPGYLMRAAALAQTTKQPTLLVLDEINRADLAKVLGEAIYLFEPNAERPPLDLPFKFDEPFGDKLELPPNLHVLGTMNTADRSLAIVDVAIRRRFAFVKLWPQIAVVEKHGCALMIEAFGRLLSIFVEYASDESFDLVPGHSYFLEKDEALAKAKLRVELAPLLEEYLAQGYVGGFSEPIRAYLQWIDSL